MKWKWILTVTSIAVILATLYAAIGGQALAIGLGVISITATIMGVFSLGIWYAHKSIQLGADLVTGAQNNNDQWDSKKMESLVQFSGDIFKIKGQQKQTDNGFPLLESGIESSDSENGETPFVIQGLDE